MVTRTSHHDYSSGLWPFATVGWPFETDSDKYKKYYPATVLETGYDILFFWVARMVIILHLLFAPWRLTCRVGYAWN